jgi:hypothetical protein
MKDFQTANQLSGRAIGALFFAGFGAIWLALSLYALERLGVATLGALSLGLVVLVVAALYLLREAKRWPRVPDDPAIGRAFGWVNVIQWIAIGVAVFLCSRMHLDAYVMSAITAIVGLHMFPLARLFRYTPHYVTGAALVAWSVASVLLAPVEALQGVAALGTGTILWLSAAVSLAIGLHAAGTRETSEGVKE